MRNLTRPMPLRNSRRASGFTLIELLAVVAVIGVLLALIMPAIASARRNAKVAAIAAEIKSLESGLENFKAKFGFYPPSKFYLYETSAGWAANPKERAVIRRMFPNFDFSRDRDLDGDGTANGSIKLHPADCLVFFLGGIPIRDTSGGKTTFSMNGFSKDPSDPFSSSGNSRLGPFTEFESARLIDTHGVNFPRYLPPIPNVHNPYMYLSSYGGKGYEDGPNDDPGDAVGNPHNDGELTGSGLNTAYRLPSGAYYKPQTYQIICAGFDNKYGDGNVPEILEPLGNTFDPQTANSDLVGPRESERDNITNFHAGMLAD